MEMQKQLKDLGLNDEITITIPVHVAHGAMAEYTQTDWAPTNLHFIMGIITKEMLDPQYLNETEARLAAEHEQAHAMTEAMKNNMFQSFLPGQRPGYIPPDFEK